MNTTPDICPDCGGLMETEDEEFSRRYDLIEEALDGVSGGMEAGLLIVFASRFLAGFDAETRQSAKRQFFKGITDETKVCVIAMCDG